MLTALIQVLILATFALANTLAFNLIFTNTDVGPHATIFATSIVFLALAVYTLSTKDNMIITIEGKVRDIEANHTSGMDALRNKQKAPASKKKLSPTHIENIRLSAIAREQSKREQKARMEKTRLASEKRKQEKK